MIYRFATLADAPLLASMNQDLIRDEGHRNAMTTGELETRMVAWLNGQYQAILFERAEATAGYALFRPESDYLYVRQFFVRPEFRRQGVGRAAIAWLIDNVRCDSKRIRIDVLVGNASGIAFWRAVGFRDYAVTLERE